MLAWRFEFGVRVVKTVRAQVVHGVTHFKFDAQGKVSLHRDYWDTGEELYMKLRLLGWLLRALRRRLTARGNVKRASRPASSASRGRRRRHATRRRTRPRTSSAKRPRARPKPDSLLDRPALAARQERDQAQAADHHREGFGFRNRRGH